jgi:tight adherence protein B
MNRCGALGTDGLFAVAAGVAAVGELAVVAAAVAGAAAAVTLTALGRDRRVRKAAGLLPRAAGRLAVAIRAALGVSEPESRGARGRGTARPSVVTAALVGLIALPLAGVPAAVAAGLVTLPLTAAARRRTAARRAAALDRGARSLAQALAAAMAAGNSVHGAIRTAAASVEEPLGAHVRHAANGLALGYSADEALVGLARRTRAPRIEVLVGALLLQRRSGGDLVRLLTELAESFRRDDAALAQARGATTQARITAWIVIAAPVGAAMLAELVHRGALTGVLEVPFALIVLLLAVCLHAAGGWLVARIARVRA